MGDNAARLKRVRGTKQGSITRKCQLALQVIENGDAERMDHLIVEVRQVYKELEFFDFDWSVRVSIESNY